jgi:hypothetical protein
LVFIGESGINCGITRLSGVLPENNGRIAIRSYGRGIVIKEPREDFPRAALLGALPGSCLVEVQAGWLRSGVLALS